MLSIIIAFGKGKEYLKDCFENKTKVDEIIHKQCLF